MTVSITPVDVSQVTGALLNQLQAYPALEGVTIARSEEQSVVNGITPMVGVYRLSVRYAQRVLGFGGGARDQRIRLLVLATESDHTSGEQCEVKLEALIQKIVGAILSDTTLGGQVNMIDEFEISYESYAKVSNLYTQTAALQFVAVGNTTATQS